MNNLQELNSLLLESNLLNFTNLDNETVDEMLDSRDSAEFESDWLKVFQTLEEKQFSADNLAAIENVREIAYKKTFAATNCSELAAYVADDFEMIAKSLLSDYTDEWLNGLFLSYLALAHSLGTWTAESLMAERAKRANREKFLEFMSQVPDIEPDEHDRLS